MLGPTRAAGVATAILIACSTSAAFAQAPAGPAPERPTLLIPFRSQDSGSFLAGGAPIDTNGDGRTADLVLTSGMSEPLGATTTQSVLEWAIVFGDVICPQGDLGNAGRLVVGAFVTRAESGDLLRGRFHSGLMCFDSASNTTSFELVGTILGGTGQFTDARGTVHVKGSTAPVLSVGADPANQQFGSVVLQTEGTIVLGPICTRPPCPL